MPEQSSKFFPEIDPEIGKAIDSYSLDQLYGDINQGNENDRYNNFRYALIELGVDAVAHGAVIKLLEEQRRSSAPLRQLIKELELRFTNGNLTVPLNALENKGLFVPRARKELKREIQRDDRISTSLFDGHTWNWGKKDSWIDEDYGVPVEYPAAISHRRWAPYDLENPKLISLAKRLAQEWWQTCEREFESRSAPETQDPKIMKLGSELRDYYRGIVEF